jgi:hypothetical protein
VLVHFARCLVEVTFRCRAAAGSEVHESGERFAAPGRNIRTRSVADRGLRRAMNDYSWPVLMLNVSGRRLDQVEARSGTLALPT